MTFGPLLSIFMTMAEIANIESQNIQVQKAAAHIIEAGFRSAGIKDGDEFASLAKLLKARKMTVDKFGEEHWEDDNTAIRGGVELILRLRRLLDNKLDDIKSATVTHKIDSADISRLEAIAKELKGLEARLVTDKTQNGEIIDV